MKSRNKMGGPPPFGGEAFLIGQAGTMVYESWVPPVKTKGKLIPSDRWPSVEPKSVDSSNAGQSITASEYLERERAAERRHEYRGGEIVRMEESSYRHAVIVSNLIRRMGNAFNGLPCHALPTNMRVLVSSTGLYTYPDVLIVCGPPEFEDRRSDTLLNPTAIIEVMSPGTAAYDRGAKFRHYQQIASFNEYILVNQDRISVEQFVRQPDNTWLLTPLEKMESRLTFASVPASIELKVIYDGVNLAE